jgi:hypothetical protein
MSFVSSADRQLDRWSRDARRHPKPTLLKMQTMFREGMDTCDIADAFNMDEAEVYNRLAKARAGE